MRAIVLAGDRPGGSALARHLGVAATALVSVAGRTNLERVLDTLNAVSQIEGGTVCGPDAQILAESAATAALIARNGYTWLAPASGPAESLSAALALEPHRPVLVTTADHALLTPAIVTQFLTAAGRSQADAVVGFVPYSTVKAAFPHSRRTRLAFADGALCGSNLFFFRNTRADAVPAFWRSMQADRKKPWRMAGRIGWSVLARYLAGRLPVAAALEVLGARTGVRLGWVEVTDPRAAVDVDSVADFELATHLLSQAEHTRRA